MTISSSSSQSARDDELTPMIGYLIARLVINRRSLIQQDATKCGKEYMKLTWYPPGRRRPDELTRTETHG